MDILAWIIVISIITGLMFSSWFLLGKVVEESQNNLRTKNDINIYKHGNVLDTSGDFDYVVHINEKDSSLNSICTFHRALNDFFGCEYVNISDRHSIEKAIKKLKMRYS